MNSSARRIRAMADARSTGPAADGSKPGRFPGAPSKRSPSEARSMGGNSTGRLIPAGRSVRPSAGTVDQSATASQPDARTAAENAAAGSVPLSSPAANAPTTRPNDPSSTAGASRSVASGGSDGGVAPGARSTTIRAPANVAPSTTAATANSGSGTATT